MSDISAIPWKLCSGQYHGGYSTAVEIRDANNVPILGFMMDELDLAEHIVKCVNEHDNLMVRAEKAEAEVERMESLLYGDANPDEGSDEG